MIGPLYGPYGHGALAHAAALTDHGANACWFHMFDEAAFAACQRHALAACVEFKTLRADFDARPELVPLGVDGEPIRHGALVQGVCLSQQTFLDEVEAALLDGVGRFHPAGIWFDYLSGAGWFESPDPDLQDSCFCPACVHTFCESTGVDADDPARIVADHLDAWVDHKCDRIAGLAARWSGVVRRHLPDCVIGLYMCPWRPHELDGALRRIFAQDYQLLAAHVDVFTPLIYCGKSGRATDWGAQWLRAAPDFVPPGRRVQPILDVAEFPDSLEAVAAAGAPCWGVQLFGGSQVFADPEQAARFAAAVGQLAARTES